MLIRCAVVLTVSEFIRLVRGFGSFGEQHGFLLPTSASQQLIDSRILSAWFGNRARESSLQAMLAGFCGKFQLVVNACRVIHLPVPVI